ncbi:MAG: hypothetical protein K0U78_16330 [Actinomycetia bacterium]|nr:hypothetical protein [Actinomycetes bacterium]
MLLYEASVAAGAEFTGLAAATGLLDFTASYDFSAVDSEVVPVVYKIVCTADNTDIVWTVEEFRPGGGTEDLARIVNAQNVQFVDLAGCRHIMRDPTINDRVWQMRFISTGNTGDASVFVQWRPERV